MSRQRRMERGQLSRGRSRYTLGRSLMRARRAGDKGPKGFEVFLDAKNLTNRTYAASVEAIADARQNTDNDSFNPANGRAFYGGIG